MTLHFVTQATMNFLLQLVLVLAGPDIFEVLQPARTFSSGVPLPKTINWGVIHFFRFFSIFHILVEMPRRSLVFQRKT